jgi:hypothetical protein
LGSAPRIYTDRGRASNLAACQEYVPWPGRVSVVRASAACLVGVSKSRGTAWCVREHGDQPLKAKSRKLKEKRKKLQINSATEVKIRKTIFENPQLPISPMLNFKFSFTEFSHKILQDLRNFARVGHSVREGWWMGTWEYRRYE